MGRRTTMNDLTDAVSISQISPDNARLRDEFLDYLRSVQRSEGTIRGYQNDLNIFFVYCKDHLGNKKFVDVTKRDLIAFQNWLIGSNGNSPARVRRIKSALSSLSNYITNILDDDPEFMDFRSVVRKIESPVNQPVREKTVLTSDQVETMLEELTRQGREMEACIVALAAYSGRRKAELVRFRVTDFEEKNLVCDGALYKTTDTIRTKGFGKGKYIYCYTLAKKFKPYFDRWMEKRSQLGIESEWLFPSRSDPAEQLRTSTIDRLMDRCGDILGVPVYAHAFRHAFVTELVRSGLPDGVIQEIVGWSSADMVKVYTDIDADEQIGMWFSGGEIRKRTDIAL